MELVSEEKSSDFGEIFPWYSSAEKSGVLARIRQRRQLLADSPPPTRLTPEDIREVEKMSRAVKNKL